MIDRHLLKLLILVTPVKIGEPTISDMTQKLIRCKCNLFTRITIAIHMLEEQMNLNSIQALNMEAMKLWQRLIKEIKQKLKVVKDKICQI